MDQNNQYAVTAIVATLDEVGKHVAELLINRHCEMSDASRLELQAELHQAMLDPEVTSDRLATIFRQVGQFPCSDPDAINQMALAIIALRSVADAAPLDNTQVISAAQAICPSIGLIETGTICDDTQKLWDTMRHLSAADIAEHIIGMVSLNRQLNLTLSEEVIQ